jgi:hypothetical protein
MHARFTGPRSLLLCSLLAVPVGGCYSGRYDLPAGEADAEGSGGADTAEGETETEGDDAPSPGGFECDPSLVPDEVPLRRLTKVQYDNTVRDLLRWALPGEADAVAQAVAPLVAAVPDDSRQAPEGIHHGGFSRLDQSVHQEHIDTTYAVGKAVGEALTSSPARLAEVVGDCAVDGDVGNDEACVDEFIGRFGQRAHRRPLTDDERTFYRGVFDGDGITQGMEPAAFADVLAVMLASPQLLYMVEHGDVAVEDRPDTYALAPYELASRLSYHLWQTMPDDELLAAAQSGAIATDEGYRAQVDRLFADPRTRVAMAEFYRQWLWLDDLPPMDGLVGNPRFDAFAGGFVPEPDTHEHMVQEVLAMLEHYTFDTEGTLADVMLSERSFATTPDLAELYGVAPWTGGEPPALPEGQRVGLLSRAALVASGTTNTRPIMKGVFIRTSLLCQSIPPPPPNANANPPAPEPDRSTREVVEQLTEQPGSACAGCHQSLINPLGYATESFDALGRFRTEQALFDETGERTGTRPVDTSSIPQVVPGDTTPSEGAADLARLMVDSGELQQCVARQYLRFSFGRPEHDERDGCALQELTTRLSEGAPLAEVLRAIALRPEFKQRVID